MRYMIADCPPKVLPIADLFYFRFSTEGAFDFRFVVANFLFRIFLLFTFHFLLFTLAASAQRLTPANNWYQFRGNQELTGLSESGLPNTLRRLWTVDLGGDIESSAAIVGTTVFVGSKKGELVSLNLYDGRIWWRFKVDEVGESSPAYNGQDGLVYIGDLNGWINAVRAKDGVKVWAFKTGSEIKSSPVYDNGRVLIGSYDEHLYCLNARTGQLLWKYKTNGPVHATPAVVNGIAYVTGCDEVFRGVRMNDGKEIFRVPSGAYIGASPAIVGQFAYYGTFNNDVFAIDLTNRKVAWRYAPQDRQFPFYSSAAVANGRVVLGGRDKRVHCLNMSDGKQLWTFTTRARVESSPAIANGRVYVGSNDGKFYVLDLNDGSKLWEFNAGAAVSASPGIGSGKIVIGAVDGKLYCFG
jgi:outer membrane protein assembly factor BamB